MITEDLHRYLHCDDQEYITTQHIVGMDMVFKGWAVKNWPDVNQGPPYSMRKLNKLIVKHSVTFYSKAWMHRNEIIQKAEKFKEYDIEWHKNLVDIIIHGTKLDMRKYIRLYPIDVTKCSNSYKRRWNVTACEMCKRA